jgi:hypothetical protein
MSRKKKKRKQKQRPRRPQGRLRQGLPDNVTVVVPPHGAKKMSEVLLEFLEPWSEGWRDEEDCRKLLSVGIIAWNAGIFSGSKRESLIEDTLRALPLGVRADARTIIDEMVRRKEALFASNRRIILNYELTMTPTGPYLQVLSTFDTP